MTVFWPPSYYILRDRVPFFLTLIYFHRNRIPRMVQDYLGYYLAFSSMVVASIASILYLQGNDMTNISGISWSPASPIEWGLFITASYLILYSRGLPSFEAFYLSFIAALGGGWLYEFTPLLTSGFDWFVFFKVNAVKVFFMEFQLFCIPIVMYLIKTRYRYKTNVLFAPITAFAVMFYVCSPWIKPLFPLYVGYYAYRWYVRLPAIGWLFALLYGIKGEKQKMEDA